MKKIILSAIVITKNNPLMVLKRCIDCIRNQTIKDIEIILLDLNEKKSPAKAAIFNDKEYFSGIKHIEIPENKNLAKAKNLAIKKTKGDYITFMWAEDYMNDKRFETVLQNFKNKKNQLVFYTNVQLTQGKQLEKIKKVHGSGQYNFLSQFIFDRNCFSLIGCFDKDMIALEDTEYFVRMDYLSLINHNYSDTATIFVNPGLYQCSSNKKMAIAYQQILLKHRTYFKKHPGRRLDYYNKISALYLKEKEYFRSFQFKFKAFFCL